MKPRITRFQVFAPAYGNLQDLIAAGRRAAYYVVDCNLNATLFHNAGPTANTTPRRQGLALACFNAKLQTYQVAASVDAYCRTYVLPTWADFLSIYTNAEYRAHLAAGPIVAVGPCQVNREPMSFVCGTLLKVCTFTPVLRLDDEGRLQLRLQPQDSTMWDENTQFLLQNPYDQ